MNLPTPVMVSGLSEAITKCGMNFPGLTSAWRRLANRSRLTRGVRPQNSQREMTMRSWINLW
jgi:hypothetical protein